MIERIYDADPGLHAEAEQERARYELTGTTDSEDGLALEFTRRHASELRYVAKWGAWYHWDGKQWRVEDTLRAYDFARLVARDAAAAGNTNDRAKIASAKTVAAIVALARADRLLAAVVEQWDADPWALNTPDGVVDLRTGKVSPHNLGLYITKMTTVGPCGDCPLWRRFLADITGGDTDLQTYFQRVAGYALTGSISEHALFFGHGTGGNGKGVFVNTLGGIWGDYAAVAPIATFLSSHTDQHPTDLAGLRGARLVTAQETEQGRRWAEAKIKSLTGGDRISARFMRQDFFTYTPQFKLLIAGNHRPHLRGVDEAIRRRLHLVPFSITFRKPDTSLAERLREEWTGILQWAVDGCLEWQRIGLAPPAAVLDATAAYLSTEDTFQTWIEERCLVAPGLYATSAELFGNWRGWAEAAGEDVGSQKALSEALAEHGFIPKRQPGTGRAGFRGLQIRPANY
jgi:putative DNA primase/helicase